MRGRRADLAGRYDPPAVGATGTRTSAAGELSPTLSSASALRADWVPSGSRHPVRQVPCSPTYLAFIGPPGGRGLRGSPGPSDGKEGVADSSPTEGFGRIRYAQGYLLSPPKLAIALLAPGSLLGPGQVLSLAGAFRHGVFQTLREMRNGDHSIGGQAHNGTRRYWMVI